VEDYKNVLLSFLDKKDSIFNITEVNLFWTLNNIYSSFLINNSPEYKSDSIVFSIVDFLRKNSKLYHLVKNLVSDRSKTYFKFDSHFYQNETNKFTNSINTLKNIIEICIENNIEIKLFLLPYEYQLRDNYQLNNYPQKLIISKLIEEEIKIIDIGDKLSLSNLKTDELFLYSDGIHFSKHGHKQIYKIIVTEEI
jgi:hypothetical protein